MVRDLFDAVLRNAPNAALAGADDLLMEAWGVIANAGAGNWERESTDWQEAAARWRDRHQASIRLPGTAPTPPKEVNP